MSTFYLNSNIFISDCTFHARNGSEKFETSALCWTSFLRIVPHRPMYRVSTEFAAFALIVAKKIEVKERSIKKLNKKSPEVLVLKSVFEINSDIPNQER